MELCCTGSSLLQTMSQEIHIAPGCSDTMPLEYEGRGNAVGKITAFAGLFTA